jgi:hypothetical protein
MAEEEEEEVTAAVAVTTAVDMIVDDPPEEDMAAVDLTVVVVEEIGLLLDILRTGIFLPEEMMDMPPEEVEGTSMPPEEVEGKIMPRRGDRVPDTTIVRLGGLLLNHPLRGETVIVRSIGAIGERGGLDFIFF